MGQSLIERGGACGHRTTTLYISDVEKIYYQDGKIEWKRNM
jgi:hypothetical protein